MEKSPNYNVEWKERQTVHLYHSINTNFKKGKPNLWCLKSGLWFSLWGIFTIKEYKIEAGPGMLILLCFLRYGSGYPDMFTWGDLSGYLRLYTLLFVCYTSKKSKIARTMGNSDIGIEFCTTQMLCLHQ